MIEYETNISVDDFIQESNGQEHFGVRTREGGHLDPLFVRTVLTAEAKTGITEKDAVVLQSDGKASTVKRINQTILNDGQNNSFWYNECIDLSDTEKIIFKLNKIYHVTIDFVSETTSYTELTKPTFAGTVTSIQFYTPPIKISSTDFIVTYDTGEYNNIAIDRYHYNSSTDAIELVYREIVTSVTLDIDTDGTTFTSWDYNASIDRYLLGVGSSDSVSQVAFLVIQDTGTSFVVESHDKFTSSFMARPMVKWWGNDKFMVSQNYQGGGDSSPYLSVMLYDSATDTITESGNRIGLSFSNDNLNINNGFFIDTNRFVLLGFASTYFDIDPTTNVITYIGQMLNIGLADHGSDNVIWNETDKTLTYLVYSNLASYREIVTLQFDASYNYVSSSFIALNTVGLNTANFILTFDSNRDPIDIPIPDDVDYDTSIMFANIKPIGFNGIALNTVAKGETVRFVIQGVVDVNSDCVYNASGNQPVVIGQHYTLSVSQTENNFLSPSAYTNDRMRAIGIGENKVILI